MTLGRLNQCRMAVRFVEVTDDNVPEGVNVTWQLH